MVFNIQAVSRREPGYVNAKYSPKLTDCTIEHPASKVPQARTEANGLPIVSFNICQEFAAGSSHGTKTERELLIGIELPDLFRQEGTNLKH